MDRKPSAAHHREARRKVLSRDRQTDSWRQALPEATTCPRLQTIPDPDQKNRDIYAPQKGIHL